jgi:transcriptional regulator
MYTPPAFQVRDAAALHRMIEANAFGILVGGGPDGLAATHLPFLLDAEGGRLIGHVARANPQWRGLADTPVLAIFPGPHAYISPRWYETEPAVPTWNYETVHVRGRARSFEDPEALRAVVGALARKYEAGRPRPWSVDSVDPAYIERQIKGIVGIEVAIERIEGTRKLNQNRSAADRAGAIAGLTASGDPASLAVAAAMSEAMGERGNPP